MNKVFVDYEGAKATVLPNLENLVCVELAKKVNELSDIVTDIEKNWRGANSQKARADINEIINAIDNFKRICINKNLADIKAQIEEYKKNEELG